MINWRNKYIQRLELMFFLFFLKAPLWSVLTLIVKLIPINLPIVFSSEIVIGAFEPESL